MEAAIAVFAAASSERAVLGVVGIILIVFLLFRWRLAATLGSGGRRLAPGLAVIVGGGSVGVAVHAAGGGSHADHGPVLWVELLLELHLQLLLLLQVVVVRVGMCLKRNRRGRDAGDGSGSHDGGLGEVNDVAHH